MPGLYGSGGGPGGNPLALLAGMGTWILEQNFKGSPEKQFGSFLCAPLMGAALAGDLGYFTKLHDAGARVPKPQTLRNDMTILGCAAFGGNTDIVAAVLHTEAGFKMLNYRFRHRDRVTALLVALERGAFGVAIQLLDAGANCSIAREDGVVPLHLAAKAGCVELVRRLTSATSVNTLTASSQSPLHMAALQSQPSCVGILVNAGADLNARDKDGCTPLYLAVAHRNSAVVLDLLARGADAGTLPVPSRRPGFAYEFLGAYRDLGVPSCMCLAAAQGQLKMVQALVQRFTRQPTQRHSISPLEVQMWKACHPTGPT